MLLWTKEDYYYFHILNFYLFSYIKKYLSRSARPSWDGAYGDSVVGWVQLRQVRNHCIVKVKVCPEHKIREKNYSVIVIIDEEKELVEEAKCQNCAAAAGIIIDFLLNNKIYQI